MRLPDVFKNISTLLSKPMSNIRYRNMTEDMANDLLDDAKWGLTMIVDLFSQLSDKEQIELYNRVKSEIQSHVELNKALGKECVFFIESIDKNLEGKARSFGFFKSLMITTHKMIDAITDLRKHTNDIFKDKEGVMIGDAQVSHGILIGCISTAMIYADFCAFLIAIFSHVISKQEHPIVPKFIIEKVIKHGGICINLINQSTNTPTGINIINTIINIRNRGNDFRLSNGNVVRDNFVITGTAAVYAFIAAFSLFVASFSSICEHIVSWRHDYYEMMKERKKWLENHVANIKLSLENVDKNDPQYVKTIQIIAYYEDKIAEYEKKLNKYYGE